jgi:hypothetical protein
MVMHPRKKVPERDRLCIFADDFDSEDALFAAAIFADGFVAEEDMEGISTERPRSNNGDDATRVGKNGIDNHRVPRD